MGTNTILWIYDDGNIATLEESVCVCVWGGGGGPLMFTWKNTLLLPMNTQENIWFTVTVEEKEGCVNIIVMQKIR